MDRVSCHNMYVLVLLATKQTLLEHLHFYKLFFIINDISNAYKL